MTYKRSRPGPKRPGGVAVANPPAITFNGLLRHAGIAPEDVLVVRHQDRDVDGARSIRELWLRNRPAFEAYQQHQSAKNRQVLANRPYWASFVAEPDTTTLFVGLYAARYAGVQAAQTGANCDAYELSLQPELLDYAGKLCVAWGAGYRSWIQRADHNDKPIIELRRAVNEEPYPGHEEFVGNLSELDTWPSGWRAALASVKGVYVLACGRTNKLYVGKADGAEGFLGRWQTYARNGHGGNAALIETPLRDAQVAILYATGTPRDGELDVVETLWKTKLRSRETGLNRN